ncbi:natriuretic peptides B [Cavia porcellus]|uniref:natriuretic peptides B n=1 Tax=Cavia porcellus TaxID=10141 RepID=UPI002FE00B7C
MGTQAGLPWLLLLLLLLHLLPERGRSHPPLDWPDQASDHQAVQVTEAQPERMTLKPCQKGKVFPEAWKPGKAGPKSTLQTFRGPQRPKVKQNSGCFRKTKMDRIDSVSGLGCKGMRQP